MGENRPFAGRKLTRAQRRAAEARAQTRSAARATAMPPPDPSTRIGNPLSSRAVRSPLAVPTPPVPRSSAGASAGTQSPEAAARTRSAIPRRATAPPPAAHANVTVEQPVRAPRLTGAAVRSASLRLLATVTAATRSRRSAPGAAARAQFGLGLLAVPAGLITASIGAGALGTDPSVPGRLLAGGLAVAVLGAWGAWWARDVIAPWPQRVGAALTALVILAFGVGAASHPVVVNNHVYLSTSSTARAHKLALAMRTDLYRISALDKLAAYDQEDARAHVDEYVPDIAELVAMNTHYAALQGHSPSSAFDTAIAHLRVAAYWESQALTSKSQLVDETDDKLITDVASYRNTAWTESLVTANALEAAAAEFHFTVNADQTGPHE